MAGPSWLVDKSRFASKIRCASGTSDHENTNWTSNPSRACPNCQHIISNDEVTQDWPGLPRGVKFDPSDQEIIWHLLAKVGHANMQPHPFIDEFIPTVNQEDGICYTHPQNLPGVKQDGVASHFFHRAIKAYSTGTRKRRKINGDDLGDVRWHKTGRTKPVIIEGDQRGCKKIMVLYVNPTKGGKAEKTNWVMHQYHLGTEEDEKDGQYVISKVFYQQQQVKQSDKTVGDVPELIVDVVAKLDPVTPKSITPDPPRSEMRASFVPGEQSALSSMEYVADEYHNMGLAVSMGQTEQKDEVEVEPELGEAEQQHGNVEAGEVYEYESQYVVDSQQLIENLTLFCDSQNLLDSQQLVENISLIDEFDEDNAGKEAKAGLSSAYAQLGPEDLKRDLEYCQNPSIDPSNIDLDTPPDFRLSQLDFGSQDSFAWIGSSKILD